MPKTTPAESILALFAGHARAAAILGDLTEMASTRGRLWFAAAYLRTLVSLTWRIVLALFVADVGRELMFNLANLYFHVTPPTWRTAHGPYLLNHMGPMMACIMSTLWFALPFAAVRFGVRDRFVQLTFAVAVGTTVSFLFIPWASLLCGGAVAVLAASAFFSATWRKPFAVLAGTGSAGLLLAGASNLLRLGPLASLAHSHIVFARTANEFAFGGSLLVIALVCSRLHRLLPVPVPPATT
jgi:hypothetical protein